MNFEGKIDDFGVKMPEKTPEIYQRLDNTDGVRHYENQEIAKYKPLVQEKTIILRETWGWRVFSGVCLILLLIVSGFFVYFVSEGKLQSSVNQSISVEPQINNNYSVTQTTQNSFNIPLNVSININKMVFVENFSQNGS